MADPVSPAAMPPLHGVGKFEVGLKGMIAAYTPDHHATIMILEGPKIIGYGMVDSCYYRNCLLAYPQPANQW